MSMLFFIFISLKTSPMKYITLLFFLVFSFLVACNTTNNEKVFDEIPKLKSDTIRIANEEIEYEITIIDGGFTSWFNTHAKPKSFYTQSNLEARNRVWILEWNRRAMLPSQYNPNLYEMTINYETSIDYGYEVNYMIYNYLVYFQLANNQQLGGFMPRI